ncbi:MAG: holo-ACP synthase, partial [Deltaproteobacteria bacterium]|nr:holo-ACP synthase [Deltaproteobacteria bacterium]
GIGIDIVQISKFDREVYAPDPDDYLRYHFSMKEIEIVDARRTENKAPLYAARWAAKEAFIKAISAPALHQPKLGISRIDFREIQILSDMHERPYIELIGDVLEYCEKKEMEKIQVSMSHDGDYAIAMVTIEAK